MIWEIRPAIPNAVMQRSIFEPRIFSKHIDKKKRQLGEFQQFLEDSPLEDPSRLKALESMYHLQKSIPDLVAEQTRRMDENRSSILRTRRSGCSAQKQEQTRTDRESQMPSRTTETVAGITRVGVALKRRRLSTPMEWQKSENRPADYAAAYFHSWRCVAAQRVTASFC